MLALNRLLITGGSGLLALNWACCARRQFDVVLGIHRHNVNLQGTRTVALDLESPKRLVQQLRQLAPDLVVHTAGMTSVEQCERQPAEAEHANADLAENIAAATAALGTGLVHISTDHLFSGDRPRVSEQEPPSPRNVYARTKLRAEQVVQKANAQALIVRTNFFGWGHHRRPSFSDWIIGGLRSGRQMTMFDDVFFSPILADTLASAVLEAVAKEASGIYNIVGEERLSKFDFAQQLADCFRLPGALLKRGGIDEAGLSASRPRDMSLENTKIRTLLQRDLGSVRGFLQELWRQEQQGRAAELRNAVT